ncbi:unnamed protein product, partial [Brenthis ino]
MGSPYHNDGAFPHYLNFLLESALDSSLVLVNNSLSKGDLAHSFVTVRSISTFATLQTMNEVTNSFMLQTLGTSAIQFRPRWFFWAKVAEAEASVEH